MKEVGDGDDDDISPENDIERARADVEMLVSAYPDETDSNDQQEQEQQQQQLKFPILVVFRLSTTAQFTLQYTHGYPITTTITIASYRCNPNETIRMEAAIYAIQQTANDCLLEQIECSLECCANAMFAFVNDNNLNNTINDNNYSGNDCSSSSSPIVISNNNNNNNNNNTNMSSPTVNTVNKNSFQFTTVQSHIEKKSIFEAYVCSIQSEHDVSIALQQLLTSHNRFQRATHNMWAYRIVETICNGNNDTNTTTTTNKNTTIVKHDNDDDGEDGAGSKLGQLLQMRNDTNVLHIVSRWFGGIQLGPRRFAIITNIARQAIIEHSTK